LDPEASIILPPPAVTTAQGQSKSIHINGKHRIRVHWGHFRRRLGIGVSRSPSIPSLADASADVTYIDSRVDSDNSSPDQDGAQVDEVVVDRNWLDDAKSFISSSEKNIPPEKVDVPFTDHDSVGVRTGGFWGLCTPLIVLRWRIFPVIVNFFSPKFPNEKSELHYINEIWFMRKVRRTSYWSVQRFPSHSLYNSSLSALTPPQPLAIWSSLFLIVIWAFNAVLIVGPVLLIDKIFLYGVSNVVYILALHPSR